MLHTCVEPEIKLLFTCQCYLQLTALYVYEEVAHVGDETFTIELLTYLDRDILCLKDFQQCLADIGRHIFLANLDEITLWQGNLK